MMMSVLLFINYYVFDWTTRADPEFTSVDSEVVLNESEIGMRDSEVEVTDDEIESIASEALLKVIKKIKPSKKTWKPNFIKNKNGYSGNENSTLSSDSQNITESQFPVSSESKTVSEILKDTVKVLCWVMTGKNNAQKSLAVNATWGKRCNKIIYITPNNETDLPSVDLGIAEGRDHLWEKTKKAFSWIYENEIDNYDWFLKADDDTYNEIDNYDWFLKADDDTYVIMENLRFMLLAYSPDDPLYLGCRFKVIVKNGYMSGGAGYILSREAVKKFVKEAIPDPKKCSNSTDGDEDTQIGACLESVGVPAVDTRDGNKKHRILPFSAGQHLEPNVTNALPPGFDAYMQYPYKQGAPDCCGEYMISFHYIDRRTMFLIENLLYYIRPIGSFDELWRNQLRENPGKPAIEILRNFALNNTQPLEKENKT
ncbi:hypothetical protein FO519_007278 [Halicephalobus sp. NKZ332]|nr:hypothetical protein FO519_007278 [Halicephalobus sp. NKZ332]